MLPAKAINELLVFLWHCQNHNDIILGWFIILLPLIFRTGKNDNNSLSSFYTTWCFKYIVCGSFIVFPGFQVSSHQFILAQENLCCKTSALLTCSGEIPTSISRTTRQAEKNKNKNEGGSTLAVICFYPSHPLWYLWVVWCTHYEIAQIICWGEEGEDKERVAGTFSTGLGLPSSAVATSSLVAPRCLSRKKVTINEHMAFSNSVARGLT